MERKPHSAAPLVILVTLMLSSVSLAHAEEAEAPTSIEQNTDEPETAPDTSATTVTRTASDTGHAKPEAESPHSVPLEIVAAVGGQALSFAAGALVGIPTGPFGMVVFGGVGFGVLSVLVVPALIDYAGTDSVSTGSYWWSMLGAFLPVAAAFATLYIRDATHDWNDENAESPWSNGAVVGGLIGGAVLLQVVGAVLFYELSRHPVEHADEEPKKRAEGITVYPLAAVSQDGSALFGLSGAF